MKKTQQFKNPTAMWLLRPLPILGMGMVVLGCVLLLLLLTVKNKTKLDPLFYGSTKTRHRFEQATETIFIFLANSSLNLHVLSSVCWVFLHMHGRPDQRSGAEWLHLRLYGLLHTAGVMSHFWRQTHNPRVPLLTPSLSLQGEPHLSSAYAVMMSYWEGVVHLVLFLTIIHCMFNG